VRAKKYVQKSFERKTLVWTPHAQQCVRPRFFLSDAVDGIATPLPMNRTMMLNAIYKDPEDDTPRHIFADYLEEHGDPRGPFIRLQCFLESSTRSGKREEWKASCEELLNAHREEWVAESPQVENCTYDFRRGFIEMATVTAAQWLKHASEILEKTPLLRDLRLLRLQPYFEQLIQEGVFTQIASLRLPHSQLNGLQVARLLDSGRLHNILELHLPYNDIANDQMPAMNTKQVAQLEMLDLRDNRITALGALSLAGSQHLGELHTFLLRSNRAGIDGFTSIMRSPNMPRLTTLNMAENSIRGEVEMPPRLEGMLPSLQQLNLDENQLRRQGVTQLCHNGYFAGLRRLSLRCNGTGEDGAAAIAACPFLDKLETLDLSLNQITGAGFASLARSTHLRKLRHLDLSGNVYTMPGAGALLEPGVFPEIQSLVLTGNPLTRRDLQRLQNRFGERVVFRLKENG